MISRPEEVVKRCANGDENEKEFSAFLCSRLRLVFLFVAAAPDFVILFGAIIKRNRAVSFLFFLFHAARLAPPDPAGNRIVVRRSGRLDLRPGSARRSRYDLKPPPTQPYALLRTFPLSRDVPAYVEQASIFLVCLDVSP